MAYLYLAVAIVAEVIATSLLKATDEFTRLLPTVGVIAGYGVAFYCLALTLRSVPVGLAYGIWSGLGIVLVAAVGWLVYGEKLDAAALIGLALIIAGAVIAGGFSQTIRH